MNDQEPDEPSPECDGRHRFRQLQERLVLVTGANGGVGFEVCQQLDDVGARVLAVVRDVNGKQSEGAENIDDLLSMSGTNFEVVDADINGPDGRSEILKKLGSRSLDGFVHCAAARPSKAPAGCGDIAVERMISVNLTTTILLGETLKSRMTKRSGTMVFISSISSKLGSTTSHAYAASKAGVNGYARSLRAELEGKTKVSLIVPGHINTGMFDGEHRDEVIQPEDVADAALWVLVTRPTVCPSKLELQRNFSGP